MSFIRHSVDFNADSAEAYQSGTIDGALFGTNYLFRGVRSDHGIGSGAFDETALSTGVTHFRYPGGGEAERIFDITRPNLSVVEQIFAGGDSDLGVAITPLSDFLAYADSIDGKVTIPIPSYRYYDAFFGLPGATRGQAEIRAEIQTFVRDHLAQSEHRDAVEILEIGNEYRNQNTPFVVRDANGNPILDASGGETIDPSSYGEMAGTIAQWIQEVLNEFPGFDPAISVQGGINANHSGKIIEAVGEAGLAAIDAVTIHAYPWIPWADGAEERVWDDANILRDWEGAANRELLSVYSEWNVGSPKGVDGFGQATGLLFQFNRMVQAGVDVAHIWPLLGVSGQNVLATDPDKMRIGGEIFQQMAQSLPGLRAMNLSAEGGGFLDVDPNVSSHVIVNNGNSGFETPADILMHAYSDDGSRMVVFLSSIVDTNLSVSLDLSQLGPIARQYDHLYGVATVPDGDRDPLGVNPRFVTPVLNAVELEGATVGDGILDIELDAYAILRLEFTSGRGADLNHGSGNSTLIGSGHGDTVDGGRGSDTLVGGLGDDVYLIRAGDGTDRIEEVGGADRIKFLGNIEAKDLSISVSGADLVITTGADAEVRVVNAAIDPSARVEWIELGDGSRFDLSRIETGLSGGTGDDNLVGADNNGFHNGSLGNDRIVGYGGEDLVLGDAGDDLLVGGTGADDLRGGVGNDVYAYYRGDGWDTVSETDGVDRLRFENVEQKSQDLILMADGRGDLLIGFYGQSLDVIQVSGAAVSLSARVEQVVFPDGTFLDLGCIVGGLNYHDTNDTILGSQHSLFINARGGDDAILGLEGNDIIMAGAGDDDIDGGAGLDVLFGGEGNDDFIFSNFPGSEDADWIEDFEHGMDRILISGYHFGLASGPVAPHAVVYGTQALDSDDRFLFDQTTGVLAFDPDGIGAAEALRFVTLKDGATLDWHDLIIF